MEFKYSTDYLIILILIVLGRYLGSNLSCQTRDMLDNNVICRQILLYFFILLAVLVASDKIYNLSSKFLTSFEIWFIILLFTKLNPYYILAVLILYTIAIIYQKRVYSSEQEKNKADMTVKSIKILIYFVLFSGFILSYSTVKKTKNFSHFKYFLGGYGCDDNYKQTCVTTNLVCTTNNSK